MRYSNSSMFEADCERVLIGRVTPIDWDASGSVTQIALLCRDKKRYTISRHGAGEELLEHMGQLVEVRGVISDDSNGDLVFLVSEFETS